MIHLHKYDVHDRSTVELQPAIRLTARLRGSLNATLRRTKKCLKTIEVPQQPLPIFPSWPTSIGGKFIPTGTCDMDQSLACRIGHKWFVVTDRRATQLTTFD